MKKYLFLLTLAVATLFGSCDDDNDPKVFKLIGETTQNLDNGLNRIFMPLSTNVDYRITSSEPWCKVVEKKMIGFTLEIDKNLDFSEREVTVAVSTNEFDTAPINITQEKGEPFFSLDDGQAKIRLERYADDIKIALSTNVPYEVVSSADWCTISNNDNFGLIIDVTENSSYRRESRVTVKPEGFDEVEISVIQSGEDLVNDGYFIDGFSNWTVTGTENMFANGGWLPEGVTEAKTIANDVSTWDNSDEVEGKVSQIITGIQPGEYELSAFRAGDSNVGSLHLYVIDEDGTESIVELHRWNNDYARVSETITITGTTIEIGIYEHRPAGCLMWYTVTGVRLE